MWFLPAGLCGGMCVSIYVLRAIKQIKSNFHSPMKFFVVSVAACEIILSFYGYVHRAWDNRVAKQHHAIQFLSV